VGHAQHSGKNDGLEDKYPDVEFRRSTYRPTSKRPRNTASGRRRRHSSTRTVNRPPSSSVSSSGTTSSQPSSARPSSRLDSPNVSSMSFENNDHQTNSNHMTNYNRRQFLGVLGAGAVASTGLSQPVSAQETPVVKMGNNYFEPIGLHIEPGTTVRFEIAAGTHSATAYENRIPSDASAFDSEVISSGGFEYTFENRARTTTTASPQVGRDGRSHRRRQPWRSSRRQSDSGR